jgi:hypothetical protein
LCGLEVYERVELKSIWGVIETSGEITELFLEMCMRGVGVQKKAGEKIGLYSISLSHFIEPW